MDALHLEGLLIQPGVASAPGGYEGPAGNRAWTPLSPRPQHLSWWFLIGDPVCPPWMLQEDSRSLMAGPSVLSS